MVSTGAGFLIRADVIPSLGDAVCNTSLWLSPSSLVGRALPAMFGYTVQPTCMQLIAYAAALCVIGGLAVAMSPRDKVLRTVHV